MKRVLIVVIILIGLALLIEVFSKKYPERKFSSHSVKYSKVVLNVRSAPSTEARVLKKLQPNEEVWIYDTLANGFAMVLYSDSTKHGWTSARYLQSNPLSKNQMAELAKESKPELAEKPLNDPGELLEFDIIKREKVGLRGDNRMVYRILVSVEEIPTDELMKNTATNIWLDGNKNWSEFTVFIYLPGMDLDYSAYGISEFSPNGLNKFFTTKSNFYGTKWK